MECFITCLLRLLILNNIFKVRLRSQSDRFIQSEKDFGRLHTPNLLLKAGSMFKTDQAALGFVQPGLENLLKAIWDICDMNTNSPCCVNSLDISFRIDSEKDYLGATSARKFLRNFPGHIIAAEMQWHFSSLENANRLPGPILCLFTNQCWKHSWGGLWTSFNTGLWMSVENIGGLWETFC